MGQIVGILISKAPDQRQWVCSEGTPQGVGGWRSEARDYAALLQNACLFCRVDFQGCTLGWYAMPLRA